jgi:hypothetical protein
MPAERLECDGEPTFSTELRHAGDLEQINVFIDKAVAQNPRPGTQTFRAMQATFGTRQQLVQR